jgi:hypothetical protein
VPENERGSWRKLSVDVDTLKKRAEAKAKSKPGGATGKSTITIRVVPPAFHCDRGHDRKRTQTV